MIILEKKNIKALLIPCFCAIMGLTTYFGKISCCCPQISMCLTNKQPQFCFWCLLLLISRYEHAGMTNIPQTSSRCCFALHQYHPAELRAWLGPLTRVEHRIKLEKYKSLFTHTFRTPGCAKKPKSVRRRSHECD